MKDTRESVAARLGLACATALACVVLTCGLALGDGPVPAAPVPAAVSDTARMAPPDSFPADSPAAAAPADSLAADTARAMADTAAAEPADTAGMAPPPAALAAPAVDSTASKKPAVRPPRQPLPAQDTTGLPENPRALRYRGIYISSGTASIKGKIEEILQRCQGTPVNGLVIDMKDDNGRLTYRSQLPLALKIGSGSGRIRDPRAMVELIHRYGMVACARLVSFKDPVLSGYRDADSSYPYAVMDAGGGQPWKQRNGESWANPYHPEVQDYLTGIAEELAGFGFDQIQFDYIRFPSDGDMSRLSYPVRIDSLEKTEVIGQVLARVRRRLDPLGVSLAVDVFGWVPWLHEDSDFGIGQDYDAIARHADVICPMLYSSHFPAKFKADHGARRGYQIVLEGTRKGDQRRGSLPTGVQPYIQGFGWNEPHFGSDYILDQIQAAEEAGGVGWIVWHAGSNYTALWKALELDRLRRERQAGQ